MVLVAVERAAKKKLGRVRFRCVRAIDRDAVESFVRDYVEPGAKVVTDGLSVYDKLKAAGFNHRPHVVTTGGDAALRALDHVHLVISLLKRWLGGTHQGAVTPAHLPAYLDEFSFRFNRRHFLRASAATALGASFAFSPSLRAASPDPKPGHATLKAGDLTAVIGDNSAEGEHRAGYNGVWSLRHLAGTRSVFVPAVAGLNLEHIVTGEQLEDRNIFFEPRNAPMSFKQVSESEAELHQPPTPTFHVESWTRFRLVAPHYLDMSFRCVAHRPVFSRGYLALFWASYINAPADKSMYFLGGLDGQKNLWTQFCTQWHNDQSTVRHRDDMFEMTFPAGGRDTLFKSLSRVRFDPPFFYGNFDDLMWLVMFDRAAGIRFTHSPSGGGVNAALQTTNPAWDFQFLVQKPEVMKEYSFRVRTVLRPRCSREEVLAEFRKWKKTK